MIASLLLTIILLYVMTHGFKLLFNNASIATQLLGIVVIVVMLGLIAAIWANSPIGAILFYLMSLFDLVSYTTVLVGSVLLGVVGTIVVVCVKNQLKN